MQPTKDMDPSEDELTAHIKASLMSHEEAYAPGAWERFNKKEKKPKGLLFWIGPVSAVAAMLLIAGGLYLYTRKNPQQAAEQATKIVSNQAPQQPGPEQPIKEKPTANREGTNPAGSGNTNITKQNPASGEAWTQAPARSGRSAGQEIQGTQKSTFKNEPAQELASRQEELPVKKAEEYPQAKEQPSRTPALEEFLNKESLAANQADKENKNTARGQENKWEMGIMLAPSIGNNTGKLNMGYGVSMGYALSEKVSLSSGISYNELAASKSISAPLTPASTAIAAPAKTLEEIETRVTGIDIPLEVKYHFSKKLYANVGVSAFAVISQKQQNSYVEEQLVQSAEGLYADNKDGFNTIVKTQRTIEKAPESEVSQDKYIGFYNFSFGYRQKISGSKSIAVEPFMKVPMKEMSKENLRLIGTGLRLKFDF